jgi:hypothetical protein
LADAAEVVVVDSATITTEADIRSTKDKATTVMTTDPVDHKGSDASMDTVTLEATTEGVTATARALVLYAILQDTRPSNTVR